MKGETVMKIFSNQSISFKEWQNFCLIIFFILAYLVLLFLGSMLIYIIFLAASQILQRSSRSGCIFTSVLPITLLFTFLDYKNEWQFGKIKCRTWIGLPEKQCRLAWLEMSSSFYLGNSIIWARFMASIVKFDRLSIIFLFWRLYSQFPYCGDDISER